MNILKLAKILYNWKNSLAISVKYKFWQTLKEKNIYTCFNVVNIIYTSIRNWLVNNNLSLEWKAKN